ncbi:MAG: hypothetical protein K1X67_26515 [Fimbriimonadaceae bacterium]|nr:hypothetical protein [Fimbriimonadaceae bacterium]
MSFEIAIRGVQSAPVAAHGTRLGCRRRETLAACIMRPTSRCLGVPIRLTDYSEGLRVGVGIFRLAGSVFRTVPFAVRAATASFPFARLTSATMIESNFASS